MATDRDTYAIETVRVAECSPEAVMAHLLDSGEWPAWQPEIVATQGPSRVAEGDVVTGHAHLLGFGVAGRSRIEIAEATTFEEDVLVGVKMRVRYHLEPVQDGTMITARLVAERATGLSGRILTLFLRRRLRTMQATALDNLVSLCRKASADMG